MSERGIQLLETADGQVSIGTPPAATPVVPALLLGQTIRNDGR